VLNNPCPRGGWLKCMKDRPGITTRANRCAESRSGGEPGRTGAARKERHRDHRLLNLELNKVENRSDELLQTPVSEKWVRIPHEARRETCRPSRVNAARSDPTRPLAISRKPMTRPREGRSFLWPTHPGGVTPACSRSIGPSSRCSIPLLAPGHARHPRRCHFPRRDFLVTSDLASFSGLLCHWSNIVVLSRGCR
jgi:hypothetical protein